jgi:pimeloyl-ACP methyl ester carboxylesterase
MRIARRSFLTGVGSLLGVSGVRVSESSAVVNKQSGWRGVRALDGGRRGYADTPMGQVHYRSVGEGTPLLLLHQSSWFLAQYANAQPLFAEQGIHSIAVDRPGYGFSDRPSEALSAEGFADNLPYVLDALGLDKVAVAGHHTGTSEGAALAHRHPDRVSCLIMHGPLYYTEAERKQRLAITPWNQQLRQDGTHLSEQFRSAYNDLSGGVASLESCQWSTFAYFLTGKNGWDGPRAAFSYDMGPAIRAMTVPTLVISNTSDPVHPMARRVLDLRSDFDYKEFEGGHTSMIYDDPEPWVDTVAAFLRE